MPACLRAPSRAAPRCRCPCVPRGARAARPCRRGLARRCRRRLPAAAPRYSRPRLHAPRPRRHHRLPLRHRRRSSGMPAPGKQPSRYVVRLHPRKTRRRRAHEERRDASEISSHSFRTQSVRPAGRVEPPLADVPTRRASLLERGQQIGEVARHAVPGVGQRVVLHVDVPDVLAGAAHERRVDRRARTESRRSSTAGTSRASRPSRPPTASRRSRRSASCRARRRTTRRCRCPGCRR